MPTTWTFRKLTIEIDQASIMNMEIREKQYSQSIGSEMNRRYRQHQAIWTAFLPLNALFPLEWSRFVSTMQICREQLPDFSIDICQQTSGGEPSDATSRVHALLGTNCNFPNIQQASESLLHDLLWQVLPPPKSGVQQLLAFLARHRVSVAITSCFQLPLVLSIIERSFLQEHDIKYVFSDSERPASGPCRETSNLLLQRCCQMSISPYNALVVTDRNEEAEFAARAGVRCFYIADFVKPTPQVTENVWKVVRSLDDVVETLDSLSKNS